LMWEKKKKREKSEYLYKLFFFFKGIKEKRFKI